MTYITPGCVDCSNAIQRNWWGGYRAQCYGCTCRAIARSLDAFKVLDSKQRHDPDTLRRTIQTALPSEDYAAARRAVWNWWRHDHPEGDK